MSEEITFITNDGVEFTFDESILELSPTLKGLVEDCGYDNPIPLPNIESKMMEMVADFCQKFSSNKKIKTENGSSFTYDLSHLDQSTLFDLILSANYLDIKELLDASCKQVSNSIKGKTTEEMREFFGIKNDFSPEEEANVRKENEWMVENKE